MVGAPKQPLRLGLAAVAGVGPVDPVAALGRLVDDRVDVARSHGTEIAHGDVVADVDHGIEAGHGGPRRLRRGVGGNGGSRLAATTPGQGRYGQSRQPTKYASAR